MSLIDYLPWPLMLGGFSYILLVVIYLPFVMFISRALWKKLPNNIGVKILSIFLMNIILWAIPLWDVVISSIEFNKACKYEAGYFIYKKVDGIEGVEAEGSSMANLMVEQGMSFSEYTDYSKRVHRVEMQDGKLVDAIIDNTQSKFLFYREVIILSDYLKKNSYILINKETKEKAGEVINFFYYPGWLDKLTLGWMGYQPSMCFSSRKYIAWKLVTDVFLIKNKIYTERNINQ